MTDQNILRHCPE